jgi:hypothetical protein
VLSQQPLLHVSCPHGLPPLEEPPEEPPDEDPLAQKPFWQVSLLVVQSKHDCAPLPHWMLLVPAWQSLFESQQPLHDAVQGTLAAPLLLPESSPVVPPPLDELLLDAPDELPLDAPDEGEAPPLLEGFPVSSAEDPEPSLGDPPPSGPGIPGTPPPVAHPASMNTSHTP